jgi:hypothetical protein
LGIATFLILLLLSLEVGIPKAGKEPCQHHVDYKPRRVNKPWDLAVTATHEKPNVNLIHVFPVDPFPRGLVGKICETRIHPMKSVHD